MSQEACPHTHDIPSDIEGRAFYIFQHLYQLAGTYDGDMMAREYPRSVMLAVEEIQEWLAYQGGGLLTAYTDTFGIEIRREGFGIMTRLPTGQP